MFNVYGAIDTEHEACSVEPWPLKATIEFIKLSKFVENNWDIVPLTM